MTSVKKAALRKLLLEKRDNTSQNLMEIYSGKIHNNLRKISEFRLATKIGIYYPLGSEVFTQKIIQESISRGLRIYLPKVIGDDLEFRQIDGFSSLESGSFDIMEPKDICPAATGMELAIIPAVCTSVDRYRIGYGRGFYDRFLAKNNVTKIALCFQKQIIREIPYQDHDIQMDYVVTEDRIYKSKV